MPDMTAPTTAEMIAWCEGEAATEHEEWEKTAGCTIRWAQHARDLADFGLMLGEKHSRRHAMLTAIAARLRAHEPEPYEGRD